MRLALPLGLLGLTAILALILIYILKPKYQEKKVSSTYVWRLSLRYRKHKIPFQWLKSSILFLVQVLILAALAFMMAQPQVVLSTRSGEKVVVLDASAAMLAEEGGETRFDRARDEIGDLAELTAPEDRFSVILAGSEASFIVRRSDSASYIRQNLAEADCGFASANLEDAMDLAEGVLAENPNAEVILYTCRNYEDPGRVTVKNVSRSEWNAAILDFTAARVGGYYQFTAKIASYGRAAEIAVGLTVDGETQRPRLASCGKDEEIEIVWSGLELGDYTAAELRLSADDAFVYDNEFYLFNPNAERFSVQLVSENPGFLYAAFRSLDKCRIDVATDLETAQASGYDLYVYDGVAPDAAPSDGAVWLIDPPDDISSSYGIGLNGTESGNFTLASSGTGTAAYSAIMSGVTPANIEVTEYARVVTYAGYESLMRRGNDPVLLARDDNGAKTIVLAFDIHMSTLPVLPDFSMLIANMFDYSVSYTVDGTIYDAGSSIELNAQANTESMTVHAVYADGTENTQTYTQYPVTLDAQKPGVYTVSQTLGGAEGQEQTEQSFFVRVPEEECDFARTEADLAQPSVVTGIGTDTTVKNDTMDIFVYLAAALLVLVCVEWGLQYREQY